MIVRLVVFGRLCTSRLAVDDEAAGGAAPDVEIGILKPTVQIHFPAQCRLLQSHL